MISDKSAEQFEQVLSISSDALSSGRYETAYHAMMTALHMAKDLASEPLLLRVAALAEEHGRSIDKNSPEHRLSSHEAESRGHISVFQLAARQARADARIIRLRATPSFADPPEPK